MTRPILLASAFLLAAGGAPALAQSPGDADLAAMRQQALTCQIGSPECEAIRDQLMLRLSEQVEFCTDASCDQARMQLAEQLRLRECDPAVLDCTMMQQEMLGETQPAAGTAVPAGAIQPGQGVDLTTPATN